MPKRIIYVSKDLDLLIKNNKNNLNLSKIFSEAVKSNIAQEKDFDNAADLSAVIERLRREKKEYRPDYFNLGKQEAWSAAKGLSYAAIQHALQYELSSETQENPIDDEFFGKHFQEVLKREKLHIDETITGFQLDGSFADYERGFIDGIKSFWEVIKDKI